MSNVKQLADAEAAKAEAEQPDEPETEQPDEDEQEAESTEPQAEPSTGEPTEADIKALNQEYGRHERALQKIMGSDFALLAPCDDCGGMGYRPPDVMKTHENFKACDVCSGYGQVLTGARDPQYATTNCPRCGGRGYLTRRVTQPTQPVEANAQGNGQQDEYGTEPWMGDPNIQPGPFAAPVS
jgi:DnaJ-class molecular chaperone